jgi:hypothetical protein
VTALLWARGMPIAAVVDKLVGDGPKFNSHCEINWNALGEILTTFDSLLSV